MDWRTANASVAVAVSFLEDGEFIIPTSGSVTLTVRGNTGVVLTGYDNLPVADPGSSSTLVTLPVGVNQLLTGDLETRYVRVSYLAGNVPLTFDYAYRLTPFLPISASPLDVRRLTGIDSKALPDADIDLHEAYYALKADVGDNFVTALTTTSRASILANNMIALKAAILLIPSMQNRVMKSETSHNEIYIRNAIDLDALLFSLTNRLADETSAMLETVTGSPATDTVTAIFFLTSPVDVITGA